MSLEDYKWDSKRKKLQLLKELRKRVEELNRNGIYIGDFYYSAKGVDFELSASVKDEFDSAKEALDNVTKNEVSLCRIVRQPFDPDDRLGFSHSPISSEISQWYSHVKSVSDEAE